MPRSFLPVLALVALLVACSPPSTAQAPQITPTLPASSSVQLNVLPEESTIHFTAQALGGQIEVLGSYGVLGGQVTLTPTENAYEVNALVLIDTPSATVGNAVIDEALKLGMESTRYPVATFNAISTTLVPVTTDPVAFTLAGTLTLHGQTQPVIMQIDPATVINGHMIAEAVMAIDLANFGISLPNAVVNSAITLHVSLIADKTAPPHSTPVSPAES